MNFIRPYISNVNLIKRKISQQRESKSMVEMKEFSQSVAVMTNLFVDETKEFVPLLRTQTENDTTKQRLKNDDDEFETAMEAIDASEEEMFEIIESEEKVRLVDEILVLRRTVEELEERMSKVKARNVQLRTENKIISDYLSNLMDDKDIFARTSG